MALFYKYFFVHANSEIVLYDVSEVAARRQYEKEYGVKPGKLLRRERW